MSAKHLLAALLSVCWVEQVTVQPTTSVPRLVGECNDGGSRGWLQSVSYGYHPGSLFGPSGLHGSTFGIPIPSSDERVQVEVIPLGEPESPPAAACCPEAYYPEREYRVRVACAVSCAVLLSVEPADSAVGPDSAANQLGIWRFPPDSRLHRYAGSLQSFNSLRSPIVPGEGTLSTAYTAFWRAPAFNVTGPNALAVRLTAVLNNDATCPGVFAEYTMPSLVVCGDGYHDLYEECEDGNTVDGDGCSSDCAIEPRWTCSHDDAITSPLNGSLISNCTRAEVLLQPASLSLREGDTANVTVRLTTFSGGTVVVQPAVDLPEVSFGVAGDNAVLRFTEADWMVPRMLTLTVAANSLVQPNRTYAIPFNVSATEALYDGMQAPSLSLQVVDDDAAGLSVSRRTLVVNEFGDAETYRVALTSEPRGSVRVELSYSPADFALLLTPQVLTFDRLNWAQGFEVVVRAPDNFDAEGSVHLNITHTVDAAHELDAGYRALDPAHSRIEVEVLDNDLVGVFFSPRKLVVTEGTTVTYNIRLGSLPAEPVAFNASVQCIPPPMVTLIPPAVDDDDVATPTPTSPDDASPSPTQTATMTNTPMLATTMTPPVQTQIAAPMTTATATPMTSSTATPTATVTATVASSQPSAVATTEVSGGTTATPMSDETPMTTTTAMTTSSMQETPSVATPTPTVSSQRRRDLLQAETPTTIATMTTTTTPPTTTTTMAMTTMPDTTTTPPPPPNDCLSVTGTQNGLVGNSMLLLGAVNWEAGQSMRVSVPDNAYADGLRRATITHTLASADPDYALLPRLSPDAPWVVDVEIVDDDAVGVLYPRSLVVVEGGGAAQFVVRLATTPRADVHVAFALEGDDTAAGRLALGVATMAWTPDAWDTERVMEVSTTSDDQVFTGSSSARITLAVSSADPAYNGFQLPEVEVRVDDNDTPRVVLDRTALPLSGDGALQLTEGGAGVALPIYLGSRPMAGTVVRVQLLSGGQVSLSPSQILFTAANFSTPVDVAVLAVDDAVIEEPLHSGEIGVLVSSTDDFYDGMQVAPLRVEISENDAANGGSVTVGVWGAVVCPTQPCGAVTLTIPPGVIRLGSSARISLGEHEPAVPSGTPIKVSNSEGLRLSATFSLTPHGATFRAPLTLAMEYDTAAADAALQSDPTWSLAFYRKASQLSEGEWERMELGSMFSGGQGTIELDSFSLWYIGVGPRSDDAPVVTPPPPAPTPPTCPQLNANDRVRSGAIALGTLLALLNAAVAAALVWLYCCRVASEELANGLADTEERESDFLKSVIEPPRIEFGTESSPPQLPAPSHLTLSGPYSGGSNDITEGYLHHHPEHFKPAIDPPQPHEAEAGTRLLRGSHGTDRVDDQAAVPPVAGDNEEDRTHSKRVK